MASDKNIKRRVKRANKIDAFSRLFGQDKARKVRKADTSLRKGKQLAKEGAKRQKEFLGEGGTGFTEPSVFDEEDKVGKEMSKLF